MKFKINDFIVYTKKMQEELQETYLKPIFNYSNSKKPDSYIEVPKKREFIVFNSLSLREKKDKKYYQVINDLFDFIDLIELLKAFSSKKLDVEKEYNINNKAAVKITQKDGKKYLSIHFTNYSYILYLDKFECTSYAAKFSKILSRCEAWQEQVQ